MIQLITAVVILGAEGRPSEPPPLTEQQAARIQRLVAAVKKQDGVVRRQLVSAQQELIGAYADYELDERRIAELQERIASLQRDLLKNYHRLQLELRRIVGPERFRTVKLRVDYNMRNRQTPTDQSNKVEDGK